MDTIHDISLKDIFLVAWYSFVAIYRERIRPIVLFEINKIMSCGNLENGYSFYSCPNCGKFLYVPFRCKSRACTTCGYQQGKYRAEKIESKLIDAKHRHITFTIPDSLWYYFRENRSLLNILFQSSAQTIFGWIKDSFKDKKYTPGMILTLHTFGRDLKWNPHIHMLLAQALVSDKPRPLFKNHPCKTFDFIPHVMLRKRFMTILLKNLKPYIPKPIINYLYLNHMNGFYVNAEKKEINLKQTVNYILRYISRPVIAKKRILKFEDNMVTFCYEDHTTSKYMEKTIHVHEFISRVIIHIPDKYFNMVRYYGFYAKPNDLNLYRKPFYIKGLKELLRTWRWRIIASFNKDPLLCTCGTCMELFIVYNPRAPAGEKFIYYEQRRKR
jgi:hypothetical protein